MSGPGVALKSKVRVRKDEDAKDEDQKTQIKDANQVKVRSYEEDEDVKLGRRKVKVKSFVNLGPVLVTHSAHAPIRLE